MHKSILTPKCRLSTRQLKRLVSMGVLKKIEVPFTRELIDIINPNASLEEYRFIILDGTVVYNTLYKGETA